MSGWPGSNRARRYLCVRGGRFVSIVLTSAKLQTHHSQMRESSSVSRKTKQPIQIRSVHKSLNLEAEMETGRSVLLDSDAACYPITLQEDANEYANYSTGGADDRQ